MIRIANGQGFWGDWLEAPVRLVEQRVHQHGRLGAGLAPPDAGPGADVAGQVDRRLGVGVGDHQITVPPSTGSTWPVM